VGRRRQGPESFEDLIRAARSHDPGRNRGGEGWPLPIRDGRWIDESSVEWRIRGRGLEPASPALRRLLKRHELRVLHAYGPRPQEVSGLELAALLERVQQYHDGTAPPYSAFLLAEFRNDTRQAMLVIEEMC